MIGACRPPPAQEKRATGIMLFGSNVTNSRVLDTNRCVQEAAAEAIDSPLSRCCSTNEWPSLTARFPLRAMVTKRPAAMRVGAGVIASLAGGQSEEFSRSNLRQPFSKPTAATRLSRATGGELRLSETAVER